MLIMYLYLKQNDADERWSWQVSKKCGDGLYDQGRGPGGVSCGIELKLKLV